MTVPGITKQLKLSKCSALLRVLACICLASAWEHTTSFVLIFLNCSILALAVHFVLCQTLLAHDIRGSLEIATVPSCTFTRLHFQSFLGLLDQFRPVLEPISVVAGDYFLRCKGLL